MLNALGSGNTVHEAGFPDLDADVRSNYIANTTILGLEQADLILIVGANPRIEAPVFNSRCVRPPCFAAVSNLFGTLPQPAEGGEALAPGGAGTLHRSAQTDQQSCLRPYVSSAHHVCFRFCYAPRGPSTAVFLHGMRKCWLDSAEVVVIGQSREALLLMAQCLSAEYANAGWMARKWRSSGSATA